MYNLLQSVTSDSCSSTKLQCCADVIPRTEVLPSHTHQPACNNYRGSERAHHHPLPHHIDVCQPESDTQQKGGIYTPGSAHTSRGAVCTQTAGQCTHKQRSSAHTSSGAVCTQTAGQCTHKQQSSAHTSSGAVCTQTAGQCTHKQRSSAHTSSGAAHTQAALSPLVWLTRGPDCMHGRYKCSGLRTNSRPGSLARWRLQTMHRLHIPALRAPTRNTHTLCVDTQHSLRTKHRMVPAHLRQRPTLSSLIIALAATTNCCRISHKTKWHGHSSPTAQQQQTPTFTYATWVGQQTSRDREPHRRRPPTNKRCGAQLPP